MQSIHVMHYIPILLKHKIRYQISRAQTLKSIVCIFLFLSYQQELYVGFDSSKLCSQGRRSMRIISRVFKQTGFLSLHGAHFSVCARWLASRSFLVKNSCLLFELVKTPEHGSGVFMTQHRHERTLLRNAFLQVWHHFLSKKAKQCLDVGDKMVRNWFYITYYTLKLMPINHRY